MTQFNFGIGNIYGAPVGGGPPAVFGTISGASLDFGGDVKMLYGQNQYPDDVAVGKRKITGKVTVGRIDGNLMNTIYFGQTASVGQWLSILNETGTIPASTPYTVTSVNAATWQADNGVYYATTGVPFVQVASAPAVGQYTVAAGVYTFAAADEGKAVLLNYAYSETTTGVTITGAQTLMGNTQTFQLLLLNQTKGKTFGFLLYSCISDKLSFPIKQDDYTEVGFDFAAYANTAGAVYKVFNS